MHPKSKLITYFTRCKIFTYPSASFSLDVLVYVIMICFCFMVNFYPEFETQRYLAANMVSKFGECDTKLSFFSLLISLFLRYKHCHLKSIEQSNKHPANSLKVHRASSCQYWPQQLLTFALANHISPQHEVKVD